MSDYRLQVVFEPTDKKAWYRKYRFAVIDPKKVNGYPANFICVFPKRIFEAGKPLSKFGKIFGEKSFELAVELLQDAIKEENNNKVKEELKKRLKAFELARPTLICSYCQQEFEQYSRMKYRRSLCKGCLEKRFLLNRN
jgi:hypothetical protein